MDRHIQWHDEKMVEAETEKRDLITRMMAYEAKVKGRMEVLTVLAGGLGAILLRIGETITNHLGWK